jgi:hypothetical protein
MYFCTSAAALDELSEMANVGVFGDGQYTSSVCPEPCACQ